MAMCAKLTAEPELPVKRSELAARWLMLVILCATLFGSYYVYDNPAAVENNLADYFEPGIGNATVTVDDDGTNTDTSSFSFRFNMLYSVYSWPNVILPFFGGYFSDLFGVRLMGVVFILLITLGQAIFALGCTLPPGDTAWYVMWVGRTVFGFGGESLSVAQSAMIASWFSGKELAFALGVNLALARIGSVVNDAVSAQIAANFPVYWALWAGLIVCVISSATGIACYYLDAKSEDRLRKNLGYRKAVRPSLMGYLLCVPFWKRKCGGGKKEEDEALVAVDDVPAIDEPPKEEIHLSAALSFPLIFWVLCLSCVTVYIAVLPFNSIASGFIAQKWLANGRPLSKVPDDEKNSIYITANSIMLTTYLVAGFLAPLMGALIDRIGLRAILNCVAAIAIVGVHALLAYTDLYPVAPLLLLGLCYAIYASALWPSIALVIEPQFHATAYGIATAVQNLGLAVAPLVIGSLMPGANCPTYDACVAGYTKVETVLIGTGAVGFLCGIALNVADYSRKYPVLNWSEAKLSAAKEKDQAADAHDDAGDSSQPLM